MLVRFLYGNHFKGSPLPGLMSSYAHDRASGTGPVRGVAYHESRISCEDVHQVISPDSNMGPDLQSAGAYTYNLGLLLCQKPCGLFDQVGKLAVEVYDLVGIGSPPYRRSLELSN